MPEVVNYIHPKIMWSPSAKSSLSYFQINAKSASTDWSLKLRSMEGLINKSNTIIIISIKSQKNEKRIL